MGLDVTVTITIDGLTKRITTDPDRSILDVLREDLRRTGSGLAASFRQWLEQFANDLEVGKFEYHKGKGLS